MKSKSFNGDQKVGGSILSPWERKLIKWAVPKIPQCISTVHLTLLTIPINLLIVYCGYLSQKNLAWTFAISVLVVFQYIADSLDGSLGKYRDTGLVRWGYFMDHLLDYYFTYSLVIAGYFISPAGVQAWFWLLGAVLTGFMVNSFLSFSATNQFEIYHYGGGPTEFRLGVILINTYIYFFGTDGFYWQVPLLCALCGTVLLVLIWNTHKRLWVMDMQAKADRLSSKK